jgi:hypothetical protein
MLIFNIWEAPSNASLTHLKNGEAAVEADFGKRESFLRLWLSAARLMYVCCRLLTLTNLTYASSKDLFPFQFPKDLPLTGMLHGVVV